MFLKQKICIIVFENLKKIEEKNSIMQSIRRKKKKERDENKLNKNKL